MTIERLKDGSVAINYTPGEYERMFSIREKFIQLIMSVDDLHLLDDMYHAAACARYGMEDHELSILE